MVRSPSRIGRRATSLGTRRLGHLERHFSCARENLQITYFQKRTVTLEGSFDLKRADSRFDVVYRAEYLTVHDLLKFFEKRENAIWRIAKINRPRKVVASARDFGNRNDVTT